MEALITYHKECLIMKKLSIISAASLIFISFSFGAGTFAAEDSKGWTSLRKDVYINMKSIAFTCGSTVSLRVKIVPKRIVTPSWLKRENN